jgi:magnesium transporter
VQPLIATPGYDRQRALRCLVYAHGSSDAPTELDDLEAISDIIETNDAFVWLDLAQPSAADLALLQREFEIHPVAIEDASLWHERPKIEFFDRYVLVVSHAASMDADGALVTHEIGIIAGRNYVITLRAFPLYPTAEIERRRSTSRSVPVDATGMLYIILDTIVDGFFPLTEAYDDRLVRLESRLFDSDKFLERTEREIFQFKRALTLFRANIAPLREVLLRLTHTEVEPLKPELSLYFRDVHDHVIRAIEQIDITRDLVNSTLDIHLASQSHRQNEVSKQLTIIATIFLPLTYITGFFGQNFGWMVNNIVSPQTFWYLGVGSQIITVIILFAFFRSRRWL